MYFLFIIIIFGSGVWGTWNRYKGYKCPHLLKERIYYFAWPSNWVNHIKQEIIYVDSVDWIILPKPVPINQLNKWLQKSVGFFNVIGPHNINSERRRNIKPNKDKNTIICCLYD